MINNASKQRLINSFNQVVASIHNLKADIASEGKKAFMDANELDIKELATLIGKVTELEHKLDKIAPSFKTYTLDIATETHPSEFPLASMTSMAEGNNKEISSNNSSEVITCYFDKDKTNITVRYKDNLNIKLCAGSSIEWKSGRPKEYENRLKRLIRSDEVEIIIQDDGDRDTLIIKRDIGFKSLNALMSFVLCKKIRNADKLLTLNSGETLCDHLSSK